MKLKIAELEAICWMQRSPKLLVMACITGPGRLSAKGRRGFGVPIWSHDVGSGYARLRCIEAGR